MCSKLQCNKSVCKEYFWRPRSTRFSLVNGVLAQLVERLNGIEEVRGSNPLGSKASAWSRYLTAGSDYWMHERERNPVGSTPNARRAKCSRLGKIDNCVALKQER